MNSETQLVIGQEPPKPKISLFELTGSYQPEKIFFREPQIKRIESIFQPPLNNLYQDYEEDAQCLLIQGFSGSGKTTVISHILKNQDGKYLFASGADNPSSFILLKSLFNVTGSTLGNVIRKAIEKIKAQKKILVIDEINKLKNLEEIKIFFDALNTIYRETKCSIILVTNRKGFLDFIPQDGKLTFFPEKVEFKNYHTSEIREILNMRVEKIQLKFPEFNIADDSAIPRIARFVYSEFDGSVRSALTLIRKCIVANDFSEEFLKVTCDKLLVEEKLDELKMLSKHHKIFLNKLFTLSVNAEGQATEVKFQDLVKETGYSPGRISQILKYFEEYHGLITSKEKNKGRAGGRTKTIQIHSQESFNLIEKIVENEL